MCSSDLLNSVVVQALQNPERRNKLQAQGVEIVGSTQEALGAFLKAEIEKWRRVSKEAGIKPE